MLTVIASFVKNEAETLMLLFFECDVIRCFWEIINVSAYIFGFLNIDYVFHMKCITCFYSNAKKSTETFVNVLILNAKYLMHQQKCLGSAPKCTLFGI